MNTGEVPLRIVNEPGWSSWVTEKFPGAITIARSNRPFIGGECIAAIYPIHRDLAEEMVRRYNEYPKLIEAVKHMRTILLAL